MPLHESFKTSQQQNTRLPKMSAVPGVDDLAYALSLAVKNPKQTIELPWKTGNGATPYIIKISCVNGVESPSWTLHVGGETDATMRWTHDTADAYLIHNLVVAECEHGHTPDPPVQAPLPPAPVVQAAPSAPDDPFAGLSGGAPSFTTQPQGGFPAQKQPPAVFAQPPMPTSFPPPPQPVIPPPPDSLLAPAFNQAPAPLPPQPNAPPPIPTTPASYDQQSMTMPPSSQLRSGSFAQLGPDGYVSPAARLQTDEQPPAQVPAPAPPALQPQTVQAQIPTPAPPPQQPQAVPPQPVSPADQQKPLPPPVELDRAAVDGVFRSLTNQETGFIMQSSLLFFLVNEYSRFQRGGKPFSIIRFELCSRSPDNNWQPLSSQAAREAGKRFFGIMRPLDWLSHWEGAEYCFLLPHSDRSEAAQFAQVVQRSLSSGPLLPGMDPQTVMIFMGVASMPEDCSHPGVLLAAAQAAQRQARQSGQPVFLFADVK